MIAGVDYSLVCPCICIIPDTKNFSYDTCTFHYLTPKHKLADKFLKGKIHGYEHKTYSTEEQRHNNICHWALDILNGVDNIVLEDYSMGSRGRVFNIAENTGLLKHHLWRFSKHVVKAAPTTIKKFATGKGNADKAKMYEFFLAETGCDLLKIFDIKTLGSPASDIADSYYMAKYAHHLLYPIS